MKSIHLTEKDIMENIFLLRAEIQFHCGDGTGKTPDGLCQKCRHNKELIEKLLAHLNKK